MPVSEALEELPKGGVFLCSLVIWVGVYALMYDFLDLATRLTVFSLSFFIFSLGWTALAIITKQKREKQE